MKIIIPIKQVPETKSVKMDEKTGTVIREGVEAIINPLDLYAIELAVQLKEKYGFSLIAISMGPPKAVDALKEAIAMGIDDAFLLSDKALAGSDTWATSYALAEMIKYIGDYSLVICGERATDGDTGQVGPELAASLGIPVISYVNRFIEFAPIKKEIYVHRLTEEGEEIFCAPLPVLLTVVKEVSEPRLPTLRGKLKAKAQKIPVLKAENLKLDTTKIGLDGSPTRVVKIFRPKIARNCFKFIAKDPAKVEEAGIKFYEFLKSREISS